MLCTVILAFILNVLAQRLFYSYKSAQYKVHLSYVTCEGQVC